ncbi:MAG: hypothetical protein ACRDIA_06520 [Actinomycetota bacterium]
MLALGALILLTLGPPAAGQTPEPDQGDPGADGPGIIDTSGSNGQSGSSGNKGASRRGATSSSLPGASGFSPGGDDSESGSETKSAGSSAAARRASRAVGEGSTAVPVILLPALPPVIELSGGTAETARESLSNPGSGQTRTQSRGPSWIGLIPVLGALILGYLLYRNPRTG